MKKVVVEYSADFRTDDIANTIYGRLRDGGFDPINVLHNYDVGLGTSRVEYNFPDNRLPSKSDLAESLKDLHPKLKIDVIGSYSRSKDV